MRDARLDLAKDLLERAYELQNQGELELAAELSRRSIDTWPTAEAHTFLGWTYRDQGRIEDAIAECKKAIGLDPGYGTPYNDIGAYLIELGRPDEAVPWLEQAIGSERFDTPHFAWYNLGRVYLAKETFNLATEYFQKACDVAPGYEPASDALLRIRRLLQ